MIANFMDVLFGCWHSNYSFPITTRQGARNAASRVTGTYVVCLDCGREFPYDLKTMKVVSEASVAKTGPGMGEAEPLVIKQAA